LLDHLSTQIALELWDFDFAFVNASDQSAYYGGVRIDTAYHIFACHHRTHGLEFH
jgi:hypothetical protein